MTRQESLDILNEVNRKLDSMTQKEIFDHMCSTSSAYRSYIYDIISNFGEDNIYGHDFMNLPDDFSDPNEVKTERFENTLWTPASGGESHKYTNVNGLKPEDVHLDRIDNKTDSFSFEGGLPKGKLTFMQGEKVTKRHKPIFIKVEHEKEDENEPFAYFVLTLDQYRKLDIVFLDYKNLLYKEIGRLSNLKFTTDEIQNRLDKLKLLNEVIDFVYESIDDSDHLEDEEEEDVPNVFTGYKFTDSGMPVLDQNWLSSNAIDDIKRKYMGSERQSTESERESLKELYKNVYCSSKTDGGDSCSDSQNPSDGS